MTILLLAGLAILLLLGAATIGGRIGAHYHDAADLALADTHTARPMTAAPAPVPTAAAATTAAADGQPGRRRRDRSAAAGA